MLVVAAAITDGAGKWLMQRRPAHKHHGGLWEFPGGKVERGEFPRDALVRELYEELGVTLDPRSFAAVAFADGEGTAGDAAIVILLYTTVFGGGPVAALEGGEIGWFTPGEIAGLTLPPLDRLLAGQLFAGAA
jgi:8-oxo-dGTP diphosphatase